LTTIDKVQFFASLQREDVHDKHPNEKDAARFHLDRVDDRRRDHRYFGGYCATGISGLHKKVEIF
jgi:hypothetical protein